MFSLELQRHAVWPSWLLLLMPGWESDSGLTKQHLPPPVLLHPSQATTLDPAKDTKPKSIQFMSPDNLLKFFHHYPSVSLIKSEALWQDSKEKSASTVGGQAKNCLERSGLYWDNSSTPSRDPRGGAESMLAVSVDEMWLCWINQQDGHFHWSLATWLHNRFI